MVLWCTGPLEKFNAFKCDGTKAAFYVVSE